LFAIAQAPAGGIPVITIDGPTASGKGTLAATLAQRLGWHQLDSGLLYRATALAAIRCGLVGAEFTADTGAALAELATGLDLRFDGAQVLLDGVDVEADLRTQAVGEMASRIAALPQLRAALVEVQLAFRQLPGLVADGRDMGTVIFPDAGLKIFLVASAATRALRRHKQLISKGFEANIEDLRADLTARDVRDSSRIVAPLKAAPDALELDNSGQTVDQSVDWVLEQWNQRRPEVQAIPPAP
jgi:3-phosphoshikimate 1-carboxyvinyltransferase